MRLFQNSGIYPGYCHDFARFAVLPMTSRG